MAYKEAAPAANSLQGMVNVAHHAEVAILDELRAHDTQFEKPAPKTPVPRQTARDILNLMSIMLMPRD
jgi:hypothetical protein